MRPSLREFTATLRRQALRAIRGRRSQTALNRRLGYGFNQVHKWENGTKLLRWGEFVALCQACKLDAPAALRRCLGLEGEEATSFVKALVPAEDVARVALRLGCSAARLARWRSGRALPTVDETFALMIVVRVSLVVFFRQLLGDVARLDCLRDEALARDGLAASLAALLDSWETTSIERSDAALEPRKLRDTLPPKAPLAASVFAEFGCDPSLHRDGGAEQSIVGTVSLGAQRQIAAMLAQWTREVHRICRSDEAPGERVVVALRLQLRTLAGE